MTIAYNSVNTSSNSFFNYTIQMKRQMILWLYLLITPFTFAQRPPRCLQADPFTINYDSVKITVQSWPNKLVVINQIENRKSVLITEYFIIDNTVVQAKTFFKHLNEPNTVIDSNLFEIHNLLRSKTKSLHWANEHVEIKLKAKEEVLNAILSVNGSQNVFELQFYFDSSCLIMVNAQDRSKRYVDSMSLDNKRVKFITTIDEKQKLEKHNCWINGYLFSFEDDQFEKIRGKKVKITGRITISKGSNSPYHERSYSSDGRRILSQGYGQDIMIIIDPKIKILKH